MVLIKSCKVNFVLSDKYLELRIKVKNESERNGKLVEKVESVYLNALPFSNIK